MPDGYLVNLGDSSLDPGDSTATSLTTFTTATNLGAGTWNFDWTAFGSSGNFTIAGTYQVGAGGNVYFVPNSPLPGFVTVTSAQVATAPSYTAGIFGTPSDDTLIGTEGADTIYGGPDTSPSGTANDSIEANGGDDTVFGGDGNDIISGGGGDDVLNGQDGNDTITGGSGSDSLDGGSGDDVLDGGGETLAPAAEESLNWELEAADEGSIAGGFTQNTGTMDVHFSYSNAGNGTAALVESSETQYTEGGEPFDTTSALELRGTGLGATSEVEINFVAGALNRTNEVMDVSFRINDIDRGGWWDQVTVTALDEDGNPVAVTLTPAGNDTVSGNVITAGNTSETPADAQGSVLVEIAGPVHWIIVSYANLDDATQAVYLTDIHFSPIETDGPDTLTGGTGNDTLTLASQDLGQGGDGDDLFLIDPDVQNGGPITVVGGEGGEVDGDTLDFGGLLVPGSIVYTNTDDDAGGFSGTATLTDGRTVTFSEIENIICFTAGTAIMTPQGERRIETLRPGDMVLTLDNGPQKLRWIGRKTVSASGAFAPVRFARGAIGNHRDLLVSPQHRMICGGYLTQLHFGEPEVLAPAKSLVDNLGVTVAYGGMVTYVHMLFDAHEIVLANGAPSESFYPGECGLGTLDDPARDELFRLFPDLRADAGTYGPASRVCVKAQEARALVAG